MNALIKFNGGAELDAIDQDLMAEMENEDSAFDFIPSRIMFPSGTSTTFQTSDGDVIKPGFEAVICVSQKARALWESKETKRIPPLCQSNNGVVGYFDHSDPERVKAALALSIKHPALRVLDAQSADGPFPCNTCPFAQWGSDLRGGSGQGCKSLRRLIVMIKGWTMPAILTVPPSSIKVLDQYLSARVQRGEPYFACWTRFDLSKETNKAGQTYAALRLSYASPLTQEEKYGVRDLRARYVQLVREIGIDSSDYEVSEATTSEEGNVPF